MQLLIPFSKDTNPSNCVSFIILLLSILITLGAPFVNCSEMFFSVKKSFRIVLLHGLSRVMSGYLSRMNTQKKNNAFQNAVRD